MVFYGWQIQSVPDTEVTIVNKNIDRTKPVVFKSSVLGNDMVKANIVENCNQLARDVNKFNIVILSSSSLQDFQTTCNSFFPYLSEDAIIIIESTGYVHLEPFVQLCIPKSKKFTICSIMNEFDVRQINSSEFSHKIRNNENRIYLGTTSNGNLGSNQSFVRVLKLFQGVQENASKSISLLKSVNTKEFMTYQWKLALPRIVFGPLSIVFEAKFPEELSSQILSKPLVSGLIKEIFRIVKKMDCKLVKGFENEVNLLKNWSQCYPSRQGNDDLLDSPQLFYQFYKQNDLEIDLLLLQPILLGDDYKIGTPYLENLYSIMCQLIKLNGKNNKSIFFTRGSGNNQSIQEYDEKMAQLNDLTKGLYEKESQMSKINSAIRESEILKSKLNNDIINSEETLKALNLQINENDNQLRMMKLQISKLEDEYSYKQNNLKNFVPPSNTMQNASESQNVSGDKGLNVNQPNPKAYRESIQPTDNLEDLTDIALYGDKMDNNGYPDPTVQTPPAHVMNGNLNNLPQHPTKAEMPQGFEDNPQDSLENNNFQKDPNHLIKENGDASHTNPSYNSNVPQNGYVQQNGYNPNGRQQNAFIPNGSQQQGYLPNGGQQPGGQQNGYGSYGNPHIYSQNNNRSMPQMGFNQNQMPAYPQQYSPQGQHNYPQQNYPPQNFPPQNYPPQNFNAYNNNMPSDQQPPHGLPSNGMPLNNMPPNLRNNRYQNGAPTRSRISSVNSFHENGHGYNPQFSPQFGHNEPSFQNAAPIDPSLEQRFKAGPKRQNRRSAFPHMNSNVEGLDFGGRGGMPGAQSIIGAKQRNPNQAQVGNLAGKSSNQNLQKMGQSHTQSLTSQLQFLQIPAQQTESAGSTNSSSNSTNAPLTPQGDNVQEGVQLNVPSNENYKPLGGVATSNINPNDKEKKKKKGLFRKK